MPNLERVMENNVLEIAMSLFDLEVISHAIVIIGAIGVIGK